MASTDSWWLIGYKPIGPVSGWTFSAYQGTKAQAQAKQHLAVDGTLDGPFSTQADALAAEAKEKTKPIPAIGLPGVSAMPSTTSPMRTHVFACPSRWKKSPIAARPPSGLL